MKIRLKKRALAYIILVLGMICGYGSYIEAQRNSRRMHRSRGPMHRRTRWSSKRYSGLRPRARKTGSARYTNFNYYRPQDRPLAYYRRDNPVYYQHMSYTSANYFPTYGAHYGLYGRRGGISYAYGF